MCFFRRPDCSYTLGSCPRSLSPAAVADTLGTSSEFSLGARLSLPPPPPPFPVQPYVSHHPPYERKSSFVGVLLSASCWPRHSCRIPDTGLRPCPPPLLTTPCSSSPGSCSSLNRASFCVVERSVVAPLHGRGHRPRLPRLQGVGPDQKDNVSLAK